MKIYKNVQELERGVLVVFKTPNHSMDYLIGHRLENVMVEVRFISSQENIREFPLSSVKSYQYILDDEGNKIKTNSLSK